MAALEVRSDSGARLRHAGRQTESHGGGVADSTQSGAARDRRRRHRAGRHVVRVGRPVDRRHAAAHAAPAHGFHLLAVAPARSFKRKKAGNVIPRHHLLFPFLR